MPICRIRQPSHYSEPTARVRSSSRTANCPSERKTQRQLNLPGVGGCSYFAECARAEVDGRVLHLHGVGHVVELAAQLEVPVFADREPLAKRKIDVKPSIPLDEKRPGVAVSERRG